MADKDFTHNATFVGMNGSMGLVHGRTYSVRGRNPITGRVKTNRCPYGSIEKVQENWVVSDNVSDCGTRSSDILYNTINVMLWRHPRCASCAGHYAPSNHACDRCVKGSAWRKADESYLSGMQTRR